MAVDVGGVSKIVSAVTGSDGFELDVGSGRGASGVVSGGEVKEFGIFDGKLASLYPGSGNRFDFVFLTGEVAVSDSGLVDGGASNRVLLPGPRHKIRVGVLASRAGTAVQLEFRGSANLGAAALNSLRGGVAPQRVGGVVNRLRVVSILLAQRR